MPAEQPTQEQLVLDLLGGDPQALEKLLLLHHDAMLGYIRRQMPADLKGVTAPEDILQDTYARAFKSCSSFRPDGPDSFYRWLATIARNRIIDLTRFLAAAKRGGEVQVGGAVTGRNDASVNLILDQLAVHEKTPSHWATARESAAALRVALAGLKEDFREALELRYISGLPVAEIAAKMGRTERAVHMLCNRGLKQMRAAMGRASDYLSWSA